MRPASDSTETARAIAIYAGLDTVFIDVRDQALLSTIYDSQPLVNKDFYCMESLKVYRGKKISV